MRERRLKNEINVVPYIDVMLVLLVIFMVAAPMMTTASIDLPSVGKAANTPPAPLEIIVRADESLAFIDRGNKNSKEESVQLNDAVARVLAAQQAAPDRPVLLAGDKKVKYEAVLSLMDALQNAGVKKVGLLVQTGGKGK